jgi:hypothetical protein
MNRKSSWRQLWFTGHLIDAARHVFIFVGPDFEKQKCAEPRRGGFGNPFDQQRHSFPLWRIARSFEERSLGVHERLCPGIRPHRIAAIDAQKREQPIDIQSPAAGQGLPNGLILGQASANLVD